MMHSAPRQPHQPRQSGPLLRWDEARQAFIGEWRAGDGGTLRVAVAGPQMIAHVRGWQTQGSGITREEALSVSAWVESYRLWQAAGQPMPGVQVCEVVKSIEEGSAEGSAEGVAQASIDLPCEV